AQRKLWRSIAERPPPDHERGFQGGQSILKCSWLSVSSGARRAGKAMKRVSLEPGGFMAASHLQFLQQVMDVVLDRICPNSQLDSDFFVGETSTNQAQNLGLANGELRLGGYHRFPAAPPDRAQHQLCDPSRAGRAIVADHFQNVDQFTETLSATYVGSSSGLDQTQQIVVRNFR